MKVSFCCCKDDVCIQIGELKIQPKDMMTKNKIKWWLLDMAAEVIDDILTPFEKARSESKDFEKAYKNLKKLKEDLEALQNAIAQDAQTNLPPDFG